MMKLATLIVLAFALAGCATPDAIVSVGVPSVSVDYTKRTYYRPYWREPQVVVRHPGRRYGHWKR